MILWLALMAVVEAASPDHRLDAGNLPVCSNRVINEVVKRTGCTLGDARCWSRGGGFCTDHVERAIVAGTSARPLQTTRVRPEEVERWDVAVFLSRAHFALVERVVRDEDGSPVAVDLSEYNYGTCWVDAELMVTDKYKVVSRRSGVALRDVDGGFLRVRPGARN